MSEPLFDVFMLASWGGHTGLPALAASLRWALAAGVL
jgi:hypothetical protein